MQLDDSGILINGSQVEGESTLNDNSFVNMGRPSDMNEDRIISKETRDALLRASLQRDAFLQKSERSQDAKKTTSNVFADCYQGYGDSMGTANLTYRGTADLTNRRTASCKQSNSTVSVRAHLLASQQWQPNQ